MSFQRAGQCVATIVATLLWLSCGQVYRPVVIPCSVGSIPGCPTQVLPNPANFHEVFAITTNVPFFPGTAMQIDVSGDSVIATTSNNPTGANVGPNPTFGMILPNFSRIFVAGAGSVDTGVTDIVSAFSPAADSTTATGFGTVSTYSLPPGSLPVFLAATQNNTVYVANYGTNSVTALNAQLTQAGITMPVGNQPVALAETSDGSKLYVLNQADNTVQSLSTVDLSTVTTLTVGTTPVWAVERPDGQRMYVVTQGDGKLYTIQTQAGNGQAQDTILGTPQSVGGPGANYAIYDSTLNRLYVINPSVPSVFVFDATTDPPTPLSGASGLTIPAPPVTGVGPVIPTSVAALPDGSRFYVASYVVATGACPSTSIAAANCILPQVTVYDAPSLTVKTTVFPLLTPVTLSNGTTVQPLGVTPVSTCAPVTPYAPGATRFRMSTAASTDSSHVYVGICDAGTIADIAAATDPNAAGGSNAADTLMLDLNAPFSAATGATVTGEPATQNPIFLFTGQ